MSIDLKLSDDCIDKFDEMKMKSAYRYIIYSIQKDSEIVIEKAGSPDEQYDDLVKNLPKAEPRYVVCDFRYKTNDVPPRDVAKILYIYWCPEGTPGKLKFLYAGASQKFSGKLTGIHKSIEAFDFSDIDSKNIIDQIK
eukprot:TRINITY_DN169_c0_g1_i1.p2 TRINITY_DN169_c0_g1~~TRINITY_DN169_c0_g1_i1.p2  ORF type:complete len:138 (-),score=29.05 TRINITY_DN169_c0_g1_i1:129-542(-)